MFMSKAKNVSPSLKISMQLKMAKVIEVIGGSDMNTTIMIEVIKFVTALELLLKNLTINQNKNAADIAIIGNTHATTILMKAGCVTIPLSLTKQSILKIISPLLAINEMASKNFLRLSSHARS